jgi:serine/threonine-protein phosphatase PGAM5
LQLPPEAWLRLGGFNGSITHIIIRPSGSVSLLAFGDFGHMALDETTFGLTAGLES